MEGDHTEVIDLMFRSITLFKKNVPNLIHFQAYKNSREITAQITTYSTILRTNGPHVILSEIDKYSTLKIPNRSELMMYIAIKYS